MQVEIFLYMSAKVRMCERKYTDVQMPKTVSCNNLGSEFFGKHSELPSLTHCVASSGAVSRFLLCISIVAGQNRFVIW